MKKVSIKDLAKSLDLSVATVSKALRDSHEISQETKNRVLALARQLHYTPNPYASSLRKKKSNTIAVILPEVADNFFSLAINGIQSVAEKKGYHVLIYLSHEKFHHERTIVEDCGSGRVDGVLISVSGETDTSSHIEKLRKENIPVVFFDRELEGVDACSVVTNDFELGYQAAKLLLQRKCQKPLFLSLSCTLPICNQRAEGFLAALGEREPPVDYNPILYCTGTDAENRAFIAKTLRGPHPPDGVIASVERLAIQTYMVCHELDIRIPEDLKVIAFSAIEAASILDPPLTTITQPAFEIGKTAATVLFKAIEKPDHHVSAEKLVIPSQLIERVSSGR